MIQPPPEWLAGHAPDGHPSRKLHLALMPMHFVGSQHADGSIMGVALALPLGLGGRETADCLAPFLYDENSLSVPRRLFDGQWLECKVEQKTRERPPLALPGGEALIDRALSERNGSVHEMPKVWRIASEDNSVDYALRYPRNPVPASRHNLRKVPLCPGLPHIPGARPASCSVFCLHPLGPPP